MAWVYVWYFSHTYFWKSSALSQELLTENGFWHEIPTQGHSSLAINHRLTRVACRHIILLALSLKFPKKYKLPDSPKIAVVNTSTGNPVNHCVLTPSPRGTPVNIRIHLIFPESRWPSYIFCADSMGLSSFKFVQLAPKDASFLQRSGFRPFILSSTCCVVTYEIRSSLLRHIAYRLI